MTIVLAHELFSLAFDVRFKKSAKGEVSAEAKAKEKLATLQRDSRPLLYKYQEVTFEPYH